ncbi:hypothetical protein SEA_BILLNYE_198 [Streptomyces phage BillNye]|uniref:Uncharacterized protein n=2 Tax=Wilnyevirus billnye TaxID=2560486 RepID=A0A2L1IVZ1_9CAUD|nr:hypothetical protein FDJ30_gp063 [Streptomyces phage BillNye]AVD99370.1 hypothetical protein SEA_BILLNYE_198 [Streptomyces phage BillNye]QBZ72452.1 hypothetical protein SEA_CIRCINUS_198 [Streptomyces phage Circinus]
MNDMVTFEASADGGWHYFTVRFLGGNLDARAANYVKRNVHLVFLIDDDQLDGHPLLQEALYPSCEHGLSLSLCAGPGHYPMDNQFV